MSRPSVAIVDYGMGNLFSVQAACVEAGLDAVVTDDPQRCRAADGLVLPGVGAFGEAMTRLGHAGLDGAIHDFLDTSRPFLAVCLGLQLLFERSDEFGASAGLGVFPGHVERFSGTQADGRRTKVPAIGWFPARRTSPSPVGTWAVAPLDGLADDESFYFVHSYRVVPADGAHVLTHTTYGGVEYASSVVRGSIFACQFHPERSGPAGLRVYRNFAESVRSTHV